MHSIYIINRILVHLKAVFSVLVCFAKTVKVYVLTSLGILVHLLLSFDAYTSDRVIYHKSYVLHWFIWLVVEGKPTLYIQVFISDSNTSSTQPKEFGLQSINNMTLSTIRRNKIVNKVQASVIRRQQKNQSANIAKCMNVISTLFLYYTRARLMSNIIKENENGKRIRHNSTSRKSKCDRVFFNTNSVKAAHCIWGTDDYCFYNFYYSDLKSLLSQN